MTSTPSIGLGLNIVFVDWHFMGSVRIINAENETVDIVFCQRADPNLST